MEKRYERNFEIKLQSLINNVKRDQDMEEDVNMARPEEVCSPRSSWLLCGLPGLYIWPQSHELLRAA